MKIWTILALTLLVLASNATCSPMDDQYCAKITIDNKENITFAKYTESATDGNWIALSGGNPFKLPSPITCTYSGINNSISTYDDKTVEITINEDEYTDYVITYPYATHSMYTDVTGKNEVTIDFKGSTAFASQDVDVFLVSTGMTPLKEACDALTKGDTTNLRNLLDGTYDSSLNEPLDSNGDMQMNFGALDAGDYIVFVLQNTSYLSGYDDLSILSATTFQVLEYDSNISAPTEVESEDTIRVSIELLDAPNSSYTYGALLVHESAYKADIRINCNGTRAETNMTANGAYIVEEYQVAGMGMDNVNRNTVQDMINDAIGPNNGTVSFKTTDSINTSIPIITDDLKDGNYVLLVGVYRSGEKMVACGQSEVIIASTNSEAETMGKSESTSEKDNDADDGNVLTRKLASGSTQETSTNPTEEMDEGSMMSPTESESEADQEVPPTQTATEETKWAQISVIGIAILGIAGIYMKRFR